MPWLPTPVRRLLVLLSIVGVVPAGAAPLVDLSEGPPNVVILAMDTVRADHIGAFGATDVRTPNLDALATESVVFEDACSASTWTLPSFASVYTGLLPYHHRTLGGHRSRLPEDLPTLAQILHDGGYHTTALVAVDYLGRAVGMARGYDRFAKFVDTPVSTRLRSYAGRVRAVLILPPPEPWMTFVHYFDVHDPYRPPEPFDRMYYDGDPMIVPADPDRSLDVIYSDRNRVGATNLRMKYRWLEGVQDLEYPVAQYAAGVTALDDHLGTVLDQLRESGQLDRSIVIVLADHGEHLTEHGVYFTHRLPYQECLHVPLMIRLPHAEQAGRRVSDPVSLIDVLPTILELTGQTPPEALDGLSLVGAMRGEPLPYRLLFAEFGSDKSAESPRAKAVWDARYRYVEMSLEGKDTQELFDREADRAETVNLVDDRPEVVETMRKALDEMFGPERRVVATDDEVDDPIVDPEVLRRLKALGYVD